MKTFKRGEFEIMTETGKKTVDGWKNDSFGLHNPYSDRTRWWNITALKSGCLVVGFPTKGEAVLFLRNLDKHKPGVYLFLAKANIETIIPRRVSVAFKAAINQQG